MTFLPAEVCPHTTTASSRAQWLCSCSSQALWILREYLSNCPVKEDTLVHSGIMYHLHKTLNPLYIHSTNFLPHHTCHNCHHTKATYYALHFLVVAALETPHQTKKLALCEHGGNCNFQLKHSFNDRPTSSPFHRCVSFLALLCLSSCRRTGDGKGRQGSPLFPLSPGLSLLLHSIDVPTLRFWQPFAHKLHMVYERRMLELMNRCGGGTLCQYALAHH